ncbi:hypothetical protein AB833_19910 [Chromatiales bacterium (ex Bugula neritina AB1)]|nr:hypothetical protein AB833_19910 [Chromatiales bacterium (ex Bugula neritina AB1)]
MNSGEIPDPAGFLSTLVYTSDFRHTDKSNRRLMMSQATSAIPSEISFDQFRFALEYDWCPDPLSGIAVWVWFRGEPCCDDNGHQYRFYLPLGVKSSTVRDICKAFAAATHCDSLSFAMQ